MPRRAWQTGASAIGLAVLGLSCGRATATARFVSESAPPRADVDAASDAGPAWFDVPDAPVERREGIEVVDDSCATSGRPECNDDCVVFADRDPPVYEGDLRIDGRGFAPGRLFEHGSIRARPGAGEALASFWSNRLGGQVQGHAYVELSKLWLFPRVPLVVDGWVHVLATRIATRTAVHAGTLMPDIVLPPWLKPVAPLRPSRVPCGTFSLTNAEYVRPIVTEEPYRLTPGPPIPVRKSSAGPVVAHVVVTDKEPVHIGLLQRRNDDALVVLGDNRVQFVGWLPIARIVETGGGIDHGGTVGEGRSTEPRDRMRCRHVPIWVRSNGKTWEPMKLVGSTIFEGALTSSGDFRLDLGVDPNWSRLTRGDDTTGPLDPFIGREYLVRCAPVR